MKINMEWAKYKYNDVPVICVAHGPSLNKYLARLGEFKSKGFIILGLNDWYFFHHKVTPHYSIMANGVFTIETQHHNFNKYQETIIVYADSVDMTDRTRVEAILKPDYLPYDQRHFEGKTCAQLLASDKKDMGGFDPSGKCCNHIVPKRLTIQEELQLMTGYDKHFKTGDTSALHMLAFAGILGCNPIYFVGIDLDYNLGFASNNGNKGIHSINVGDLNDYRPRILDDLDIINKSISHDGREMLNLNQDSTFDTVNIGEL